MTGKRAGRSSATELSYPRFEQGIEGGFTVAPVETGFVTHTLMP